MKSKGRMQQQISQSPKEATPVNISIQKLRSPAFLSQLWKGYKGLTQCELLFLIKKGNLGAMMK